MPSPPLQMTGDPTARSVAFDILSHGEQAPDFAVRRLDEQLTAQPLPPQERRLVTELVYGTIRRQGTLDAILQTLVKRPRSQVEPPLWQLLRLGAYQLLFLDHVPAHAAVHETVELAKRVGRAGWQGFANGVLRGITRLTTTETVTEPSAAALPWIDGQYRLLQQPVFPVPEKEPAAYFAAAFSFPLWLAEHWQPRIEWPELLRLGFWYNAAPPTWLRVNPLQTTRAEYLETLTAVGISARPGEGDQSLQLLDGGRIPDLPGFAQGTVSVQDLSAMHAVWLLDPQPGEQVLDLCAAPGGKTTQIAEQMRNSGAITAVDVSPDRLAQVETACQRLGITIVETNLRKGEAPPAGGKRFDAVLVDVPCSNTGVLSRRAEARWRISARDLRELPRVQTRLLRTALASVRPGGRVVYSTCSIEPEENDAVIRTVLSAAPGWRLVEERRHQPGLPADGGYQARLEQTDTPEKT